MTDRFHTRFLLGYSFFFSTALLLSQFGHNIEWMNKHPFSFTLVFYAKCLLALTLLYLGIYTCIFKFSRVHKYKANIVITVLGSILTLIYFVPPYVMYANMNAKRTKPLDTTVLTQLRNDSINPQLSIAKRFSSTKLYYIETGIKIEYLDLDNKKTLFFPTKDIKKKRENHLTNIQETNNTLSQMKSVVVSLTIFSIVSFVGFLMLLWYKSRFKQTENETTS